MTSTEAPLDAVLGFVSGHDSSRAVIRIKENWGFSPCYGPSGTKCMFEDNPQQSNSPTASYTWQEKSPDLCWPSTARLKPGSGTKRQSGNYQKTRSFCRFGLFTLT
jgi:hypothetical protein